MISSSILLSLTLSVSAVDLGQDPTDPPGAVGKPSVADVVGCNRVPLCTAIANSNGEAWVANGQVWITDFAAGRLRLIDTLNGCTEISSCIAPGGGSPSENTLLGNVLYHYDFSAGLVFRVDPTNCTLLGFCNPPGDDLAEGLTNDGQYLWKGDSTSLYKFDPVTCQVVQTCANPPGDSADGLTMCGQYLIMLGYSGTVYQIDPSTCTVVSTCTLNQGSSGNGITSDRLDRLFVDQPARLDLVDLVCNLVFGAPLCTTPPSVMGSVGVPVTFPVSGEATNGLTNQNVTMTVAGLPAGAAMHPPLPLVGQPAVSQFNWTPGPTQVGDFTVTFTMTDQLGGTTSCTTVISIAECHQLAGTGGGGSDVAIFGHLFHTDLSSVRRTWPVTMERHPIFNVPNLTSGELRFSLQTVMYNPQMFPQNPEQWSERTEVTIRPGWSVQGVWMSPANGMHQLVVTHQQPNGQVTMAFPFTIDGM